jgi:hypothetical protein
MRTHADALRSVKRHVADSLGSDWEVRLAADDGTLLEPPYAIVATVGPALSSESALIVQITQPYTVYCYPPRSESFEQGLLDGAALTEQLWMAFVGGLTPYRVPLYDYAGVPLANGSASRNTHDYLRLVDVQVNRVPDSEDEQRVIVVCDFRASWTRPTDRHDALRSGPVLQSIRQRVIVEGQEQHVLTVGIEGDNETFGRPRVSRA